MITLPASETLISTFAGIPAEKILFLAKEMQADAAAGSRKKGSDEYSWVTETDGRIQEILLDYFRRSPLVGSYRVEAEEEHAEGFDPERASWTLLIDPLDGTSPYRRGLATWGVMVGACTSEGVLSESWNLLSTGERYGSGNIAAKDPVPLFGRRSASLDLFDYSGQPADKFIEIAARSPLLKEIEFELTQVPAAVWAGWNLITGSSDALLWIPSDKGKCWYPSYDLIFLNAVKRFGYEIALGKAGAENALVAIAPTVEETEELYRIGLELTDETISKRIVRSPDPLKIL